MTAVIVCTAQSVRLLGMDENQPAELISFSGKPFLQHLIEYLAREGVRTFEFVLNHFPERIESYLGDGTRWGCQFRFHLAPDTERVYGLVRRICARLDGPFLLAHADRIPAAGFDALQQAGDGIPVVYCSSEAGQVSWRGWASFASGDGRSFPQGDSFSAIELSLLEAVQRQRAKPQMIDRWLNVESAAGLLETATLILDEHRSVNSAIPPRGSEKAWIARNVTIHPSAQLCPPFSIEQNCRIGANARIGPYAMIGENCMVEKGSIVSNSLVASGTYIGRSLELEQVVVDRNRLVNIPLETSCLISESFLLGSLDHLGAGNAFRSIANRTVAAALFAPLFPVFVSTAAVSLLTGRAALKRRSFVTLPAEEEPRSWKLSSLFHFACTHKASLTTSRSGFLSTFIPGLISVMQGHLYLVGLPPRSEREIAAMPSDWRSIYMRGKVGLITESYVNFGDNPTSDESYSAEAFYCATWSPGKDLKLGCRYFWRLLFGSRKAHEVHRGTAAESNV